MSSGCAQPIAWEVLVDYWAGDCDLARADELEEHLMGCGICSATSARIASLTETLRGLIPPLLSRERLQRLYAQGLRITENPMRPGERKKVTFPADVDVLVHKLTGLAVSAHSRIDFALRVESTGRELVSIADAPFDAETGSVLLACQQHNASLPHDTVAEIVAHDESGETRLFRYTILHDFELTGG